MRCCSFVLYVSIQGSDHHIYRGNKICVVDFLFSLFSFENFKYVGKTCCKDQLHIYQFCAVWKANYSIRVMWSWNMMYICCVLRAIHQDCHMLSILLIHKRRDLNELYIICKCKWSQPGDTVNIPYLFF